ncbi:hypothetical protein EVA_08400 [gut metagenome]|uniref:Uncharacterized protein n=1 Tax=gut metagenome TaxID=749906 RepID=J9GML1_9ZZZZ
MLTTSNQSIIPSGRKKLMIKSVLILDEFFAMTAKIRTLFLSHINIVKYLTHRNTEVLNCPDFLLNHPNHIKRQIQQFVIPFLKIFGVNQITILNSC